MKPNEEKNILSEFEKNSFSSIKNAKKASGQYKDYAKHTLKKSKNINIRITEKDFRKIKAIAVAQGMPYQTFITHVLHKISGQADE